MTVTRLVLSKLPAIVLSFLAAATWATAQEPSPSPSPSPTPTPAQILRVTAKTIVNSNDLQKGWAVVVRFSKRPDKGPATNPANYRIININNGSQVPVSEAQLIQTSGAGDTNTQVRLVIPAADSLNADDFFHLYALKIQFSGADPQEPLQHRIEVQSGSDTTSAPGIDPHAEPKAKWTLKTSKDRDNSDIYASYEVTSARGSATTGTGDVKIAIPFFSDFWERTHKFSPFFDLKASSNEKADADSLKFGLEWLYPVHLNENPNNTFLFTGVDWINTGKVEAPKNFDNINAIWEERWLFVSKQIPGKSKKFRMFIDPFVGSELGRNLKSPLAEAEHKPVIRVYAGANLTINIPIKDVSFLKGFDFTSSYIRRWLLKGEVSIKEADGGTFNLLTFGRRPKDHSDSKFTVKVNDFFGPYVGYEWGRLPPNYELVDHKWTFGILFKAKVKAK